VEIERHHFGPERQHKHPDSYFTLPRFSDSSVHIVSVYTIFLYFALFHFLLFVFIFLNA
jgi:hypothetical protein